MPLRQTALRYSVLITLLTALSLSAAQARDPSPPGRSESQRSSVDGGLRTADNQQQAQLQQIQLQQQQDAMLRQKRRDDLREVLRVQSDEGRSTTRQLSTQEKMELRQQLRQQQEWLNK